MDDNKSKIDIYVHRARTKLESNNKIKEFSKLNDDESRIKFVLPFCDEIQIIHPEKKDYQRAESCYSLWIKFGALNFLNDAIRICPQNDDESKQLYTILIEARSKIYFEEKQYDKVLQDVAFLKQYGVHSSVETIHSYQNYQNYQNKSIKGLKTLNKSTKLNSKDINDNLTSTSKICEELNWDSKNITYPALSNKLIVKQDDTMGRYLVASDDIKTGEIVAIEKPYASIVTTNINAYKGDSFHCGHCMLYTNQIYSCPQCSTIFCCLQCLEMSKNYHQYECGMLTTLFDAGVDDIGFIALRLITQRHLSQVIAEELSLDTNNKEKNGNIYKTDDYYNVSQLVRHENLFDPLELVNVVIVSVFLLKLLITTTYFGKNCADTIKLTEELNSEQVFVGKLLLKYVQIATYNSHGVYALKVNKQINNDDLFNYKRESVGIAIYPSVSLISHSCDPSVKRYNVNNMLVVRSIRPIKAGDIVADCYGPTYWHIVKKSKRQHKMAADYRFKCACQACIENWPLFSGLNSTNLQLLCNCGGVVQSSDDVCTKCGAAIDLLPVLTSMISVESKLIKAESFFANGQYETARLLYADILDLQLKHRAPPFESMVLIQTKLQYCFMNRGNTICD